MQVALPPQRKYGIAKKKIPPKIKTIMVDDVAREVDGIWGTQRNQKMNKANGGVYDVRMAG